jgi:hypothetical protein
MRYIRFILLLPVLFLMQVKVTNLFGDEYSGQAGHAGVFAKWKGRQYRRKYVVPSNPKSTMQMIVRGFFTNAVAMWHSLSSLQRVVFSYLATGQVMSGFNLLISRYQKAATTGATLPLDPPQGIKQIGSVSNVRSDNAMTADNPFELTYAPTQIGVLTYTPQGTDTTEMDAYVDVEMGDVRIPVELAKIDGRKGLLADLAEGDKLLISYTSGGRTITREVLYTIPGGGSVIPAAVAIGAALRTEFYPIDLESVVIETEDVSEVPHTFTQLESLEILNCNYTIADSVVTPHAKVYFDLTPPADATSKVDYVSYEAIDGAKLEVTKVDTSFITFRRYSGFVGELPIAQTIEDETYDWRLSAPLFIDTIRAAQSAVLATNHELVIMTAAS